MAERKGEQGFTLVELSVALVVLALAALALTGAQTASLRNAAALEDRMLASIVAHNRMAERLALPGAEVGIAGGSEAIAGRELSWRERAIATADPAILRIEVDVRADGDGPVLAALTGFAATGAP